MVCVCVCQMCLNSFAASQKAFYASSLLCLFKSSIDLLYFPVLQYRPLLPSTSQQHVLQSRSSRMFQDLDSHSVLSMLHHLTGLGSLDQEVVFQLLQNKRKEGKCFTLLAFQGIDENRFDVLYCIATFSPPLNPP